MEKKPLCATDQRPLICISGLPEKDADGFDHMDSMRAMVRRVVEMGGEPFIMDFTKPVNVDLYNFDGFLLMDNPSDLPPRYPNEWEMHDYLQKVAAEQRSRAGDGSRLRRNGFEREVVAHAKKATAPILGIGSGMHRLNVELGGTLMNHHGTRRDIEGTELQPIAVEPHTRFAGTTHGQVDEDGRIHGFVPQQRATEVDRLEGEGRKEIKLNSVYHQTINKVGEGLHATAWDDSKLKEPLVVESTNPHWFAMGVQWHPEFLVGQPPSGHTPSEKLFGEFIAAAREQQKTHPPRPPRQKPQPKPDPQSETKPIKGPHTIAETARAKLRELLSR